ncbi:MAG: hypothetical protein ACR2I8_08955 [Steroidobacteraceae bacterium]
MNTSKLAQLHGRAEPRQACSWIRRRTGPALSAAALSLLVAGCAPTRFETTTSIPKPLVEKIPVTVGVYLPLEFREKVYEEKRQQGGGEYVIGLGKAQAAGFMRVIDAMFERVVPVSSPAAARQIDPAIRGVLEPVLDDYAFVTPIDSGTQAYAASLKYTVRLYSPDGELADSWTFTGYGSEAASSFPGKGDEALQAATQLAMRDAAAKLAAEFREQAIARALVAPGAPPPAVEVSAPPQQDPPH